MFGRHKRSSVTLKIGMIILVIFDEIVFCIVELFKVSFVDDFD